LFSGLTAFLLSGWSVKDWLALGSGFTYYSLSSILITQLKGTSLGIQVAAELGTIALLINIMREITALLIALLFRKYFGPLAPICVGVLRQWILLCLSLPVIVVLNGFLSLFSMESSWSLPYHSLLHFLLRKLKKGFFLGLFSEIR